MCARRGLILAAVSGRAPGRILSDLVVLFVILYIISDEKARKFHTVDYPHGILQAIIMQYNIIANKYRLVKGFFLFLTDFFAVFSAFFLLLSVSHKKTKEKDKNIF